MNQHYQIKTTKKNILMKIKFILFALLLVGMITSRAMCQYGEIRGIITDKVTGDPMIGATVTYEMDGMLKGAAADENGKYVLKPLVSGAYKLTYKFVTYEPVTIEGILVSSEKATYVDVTMEQNNELPPVVIKWVEPIIDKGKTATMTVIGPEQIRTSPDRGVMNMVANTSGVYQEDRGGSLNVRGSRSDATQYVVDGIKIMGEFSLPNSAIAEITVITGGIPAMFGDATGGIVLITTKSYMTRHKY
jgi:carboxypeptidase family protein/TonB-dependent receptor-like protein